MLTSTRSARGARTAGEYFASTTGPTVPRTRARARDASSRDTLTARRRRPARAPSASYPGVSTTPVRRPETPTTAPFARAATRSARGTRVGHGRRLSCATLPAPPPRVSSGRHRQPPPRPSPMPCEHGRTQPGGATSRCRRRSASCPGGRRAVAVVDRFAGALAHRAVCSNSPSWTTCWLPRTSPRARRSRRRPPAAGDPGSTPRPRRRCRSARTAADRGAAELLRASADVRVAGVQP